MKTRILVTGSNGQLGSELQNISKTYNAFEFLFYDIDSLDLTDEQLTRSLINEKKPEYIINCAAYTAVDKAEQDESNAFLINAEVPKLLAEISKEIGSRFIHVSTDYVFDGRGYKPYNEDDQTNPQSVYGKSKLSGEQAVLKHNNTMVIRTSWLYSVYGNNFLKTVLRLANERNELGMIFDQIGTPTYAKDLAIAIMEIIRKSNEGLVGFSQGIYHYSNEGVCSWYDFAKSIIEFAGLQCNVRPIETTEYPLPASRPHYSVLNKKKIKSTYGIEIPYWLDSMHKSLENLLNK